MEGAVENHVAVVETDTGRDGDIRIHNGTERLCVAVSHIDEAGTEDAAGGAFVDSGEEIRHRAGEPDRDAACGGYDTVSADAVRIRDISETVHSRADSGG